MNDYDKMTKELKRIRYWIILLLAISVMFVVAFYFLKFHMRSITDNPTEWGNFGDYFNGMLSPIIGIINTVILIYIAIVGNGLSFKIQEQSEKNQKEIFKGQVINGIVKQLNLNFDGMISAISKKEIKDFNENWYKINGQIEIIQNVLKDLNIISLKDDFDKLCEDINEHNNSEEIHLCINTEEIKKMLELRNGFITILFSGLLKTDTHE
jgi:hypothetical protein